MNKQIVTKNKNEDLGRQLYELLKFASDAYLVLSEKINDESEGCEEADDHPLSIYLTNSVRTLRKAEFLVTTILECDSTGSVLKQIEKLEVLDQLRGESVPTKKIVAKFKKFNS